MMWKYYALLSALFAALTALLVKCGVRGVNSNLATAIRTAVVLALTWGIVLFSDAKVQFRDLSGKNILFLVLSGLATGLSWLFYFKALQTGDVSKVAPIDKLSVVIAVIFGILFLHEKVSWEIIVGSGLILAGSVLLVMK